MLGVDQIKGSEVIYPISVKTHGEKAVRRRARDAEAAFGSLWKKTTCCPAVRSASLAVRALLRRVSRRKPEPAPDPTTNKPNETNPFAGE